MTRILLLIVLLSVFGAVLPACAQSRPKVLASISIIADIAQTIAGERLTVENIVPRDGEVHSFEPKPDDVRRVADAQLILINGARLESFLDKLVKASGTQATIVEVSKGIKIRRFGEGETKYLGVSGEYPCAAPTEGEEAGDCDPHFWQDPLNVVHYAENIRDALTALDPAGAPEYAKNADVYIEKLKRLDTEITTTLGQIAPEKRIIVTNHDSLGYFAARYDFKILGVILPGGAAGELTEPNPKQIAAVIEIIRSAKVKAVFVENVSSDKMAAQIAEQAGVKVVTGLYTDALSEKGTPGDTYLGMMEANLKAISDALK